MNTKPTLTALTRPELSLMATAEQARREWDQHYAGHGPWLVSVPGWSRALTMLDAWSRCAGGAR